MAIRYRSDGPTLPGCASDIGGLLRIKAAAPIKPAKPQQACDIGLFSDEAGQLDLCEMFQGPEDDDAF
jgi:hypothetical protein